MAKKERLIPVRVTEVVHQIVDIYVDANLSDEAFYASIEKQRLEREDREVLGVADVQWRTL